MKGVSLGPLTDCLQISSSGLEGCFKNMFYGSLQGSVFWQSIGSIYSLKSLELVKHENMVLNVKTFIFISLKKPE